MTPSKQPITNEDASSQEVPSQEAPPQEEVAQPETVLSEVTEATEQPQDGIIEGGWEYVVPTYALSWIVLVAYSWSVLTKFKRGS